MYRPRHDSQFEPRTKASPYDCNMAAAADALRFWSLGLIDRNHDQLRHDSGTYSEVTDDNPNNNGTNIDDAARALQKNGVETVVFHVADEQGWGDVRRALVPGSVVIAHGDYDRVPYALRGQHGKHFLGLHSVLFHHRSRTGKVCVLDGVADGPGYRYWPDDVAHAYMRKFPGTGYTYLVVTQRRLKASVARANVRKHPKLGARIRGVITPRSRVVYGGTVTGQKVGRSNKWYRVYYRGGIAYVHSSVAKPI